MSDPVIEEPPDLGLWLVYVSPETDCFQQRLSRLHLSAKRCRGATLAEVASVLVI
jgi:hypothetical protein